MKKNNKENEKFDDQVEGRNSVIELLESGRDINKIYISNGEKHGSVNKIIELAKKSQLSFTSLLIPKPSLPITIAIGILKS